MDWLTNLVGTLNDIAWGPLTIILLLGSGLYYSVILKGLQFRGFGHAVELVSGKFDNVNDTGEITHFQALSAALSATIGTGNIAGVATAIAIGGPGAVFWMWMVALVGMLLKYASCTLAQKFRQVHPDGTVSGGPMYYLEEGLGLKWLAVFFSIFTIIASFGIGNMVQANSVADPLSRLMTAGGGDPGKAKIIIGIILAVLTASVIIGGIKRIGQVASAIVPVMCVIYVAGALVILFRNFHQLDDALMMILGQAFTGTAAVGGFSGATVMVGIKMGVARALFSSEAGLGSAPMAHAAARTNEPVREGLVAMLEPFIDTLVICTMTALVIVSMGTWTHTVDGKQLNGASLTAAAFGQGLPGLGEYVVTVGILFFAFSTLISWSYYGDRCAEYLLGPKAIPVYRWIYVALIPVGAVIHLKLVWDVSDIFNALMAFPNIVGILCLSGLVVKMTDEYFKSGHDKPPARTEE